MSFAVSIEHTTVTINGHTCEGWADDNEALSFPDIDLTNETVGPDGLMAVSGTGHRGGELMLKFQANSPSVAFFGTLLARHQNGASVVFTGTIGNPQTGQTTRLDGGVFKRAPLGQSLGSGTPKMQEYVLVFQSIQTNYDGMQTQAAPVIAPQGGVTNGR